MAMALAASSSLTTAKRSAGAMGPSGMVSKKRSQSKVVARAVAQSRSSAGAPGLSHATMATTPDLVISCRHPGQSASPQCAQTTAAGTSESTSSSTSTGAARTFAAVSRRNAMACYLQPRARLEHATAGRSVHHLARRGAPADLDVIDTPTEEQGEADGHHRQHERGVDADSPGEMQRDQVAALLGPPEQDGGGGARNGGQERDGDPRAAHVHDGAARDDGGHQHEPAHARSPCPPQPPG